jgi:hypothetical protein
MLLDELLAHFDCRLAEFDVGVRQGVCRTVYSGIYQIGDWIFGGHIEGAERRGGQEPLD